MTTDAARKPVGLSIFFPAYNDSGTIASLVITARRTAQRLTTDYEAANKSVRDASRFLARARMDCPAAGTGPAADYLINASFATTAQNLALTGKAATPTAGSYLLAYWTDPATVTMSVTCVANGGTYAGVFTDLAFIPRITVTANVPFSFLFGTIVFSSAGLTLVAAHTEVGIGE